MPDDTDPRDYGHRPEFISDDDQRERDGIHPTEYDIAGEGAALRHELERQMEDLIEDAQDWLQNTSDPDAQGIYDAMVDLYERLGNSPEESEAPAMGTEDVLRSS